MASALLLDQEGADGRNIELTIEVHMWLQRRLVSPYVTVLCNQLSGLWPYFGMKLRCVCRLFALQ